MALERVDLAVVGAGPAGLSAATVVAAAGGRVIVLDESPWTGGRLRSQVHQESKPGPDGRTVWSRGPDKAAKLASGAIKAGAELRPGVSVWGLFPESNPEAEWYLGLAPVLPGEEGDKTLFGLGAKTVIVASGAVQNPVPFPGWTLPGVITAGAAQTLLNLHFVKPGQRAAVVGVDPLALSVAGLMSLAGMEVKGVILPPQNGLHLGPASPKQALVSLARLADHGPGLSLSLTGKLLSIFSRLSSELFPKKGIKVWGVPLMLRKAVVSVGGQGRVERLRVADLRADGRFYDKDIEDWAVDVVLTSAGLSPLAELLQVAGCPLVHIPQLGGWTPVHGPGLETPMEGLFVAGSVTGVEGAAVATAQGRLAGISAAAHLGLIPAQKTREKRESYRGAVIEARKDSLPLMEGMETGRARMAELWHRDGLPEP